MTKSPPWGRNAPPHSKANTGRPAWAGGDKPKGRFIKPHKGNPNPRKDKSKGEISPSPYRMIEAPDAGLHRMLNNRQRAKRSAEADNGTPCPNCGKKHNRPNAKYCSPECREAFWQSVAPETLPFVKGYRKGKNRGKSEALLEMIERKRALGHDHEDDF